MQIKLWGVRGSLPAPLAPDAVKSQARLVLSEALKRNLSGEVELNNYFDSLPVSKLGGFGGNTACYEITSGDQSVIIDAGSGLRALGHEVTFSAPGNQCRVFHIFLTHFHWDHLIGLCFFMPIFTPGVEVHFYAVQPELEMVIRTLFRKPFFPVPYESLGATIFFHQLDARKPVLVNGILLTPYLLDHPDPCWGYRVEKNGKALALCVDTECVRVSREALGPDLPLYQNLDAMIFDAQFTLSEAAKRVSWGHAAATIGLDLAIREQIKKVYFVHHDPSLSDQEIAHAEAQTRAYYQSFMEAERRAKRSAFQVDWSFAHEGLVINL